MNWRIAGYGFRYFARYGTAWFIPQRVAYCVMVEDGVITFHFRGISFRTLCNIFTFLIPSNGKGAADDFVMSREHDCRYLNGHGYWRWQVSIVNLHERFCSLEDLILLVESRFKASAIGTIQRMPVDDFLNTTDAGRWNFDCRTKIRKLKIKQK